MKRALIIVVLLLVPAAGYSGPSDDLKGLTRAERRLMLRYFWQAPSVFLAARKARSEAAARYPGFVGQDDPRDAFRHAFWNGSMTRRLKSTRAAERWGNAHEEIPNNPPQRKAMDLANNRTGRERTWAKRQVGGPWWWQTTQLPDDGAIAADIEAAVTGGDLLMIEEVGGQRDPHAGALVPTQ
jgi:hypothetical protein